MIVVFVSADYSFLSALHQMTDVVFPESISPAFRHLRLRYCPVCLSRHETFSPFSLYLRGRKFRFSYSVAPVSGSLSYRGRVGVSVTDNGGELKSDATFVAIPQRLAFNWDLGNKLRLFVGGPFGQIVIGKHGVVMKTAMRMDEVDTKWAVSLGESINFRATFQNSSMYTGCYIEQGADANKCSGRFVAQAQVIKYWTLSGMLAVFSSAYAERFRPSGGVYLRTKYLRFGVSRAPDDVSIGARIMWNKYSVSLAGRGPVAGPLAWKMGIAHHPDPKSRIFCGLLKDHFVVRAEKTTPVGITLMWAVMLNRRQKMAIGARFGVSYSEQRSKRRTD